MVESDVSSVVSTRKGKKLTALEDAIKRTLDELVADLRNPKYDQTYTETLSTIVTARSGKELIAELSKPTSALCAAIPTDVLKKTQEGRKYLAGLSIIQPMLTSAEPTNDSSHCREVERVSSSTSLSTTSNTTTESFSQLLPGDENKALLDLVQDVFASGDLCRLEGKDTSELDTGDFLGMFSSVKDVIEKKAAAGTLDLESIDRQANHMMQVLSRDHPEIQGLLSNQNVLNLLPALSSAFQ